LRFFIRAGKSRDKGKHRQQQSRKIRRNSVIVKPDALVDRANTVVWFDAWRFVLRLLRTTDRLLRIAGQTGRSRKIVEKNPSLDVNGLFGDRGLCKDPGVSDRGCTQETTDHGDSIRIG
jgi:hypothetical protein